MRSKGLAHQAIQSEFLEMINEEISSAEDEKYGKELVSLLYEISPPIPPPKTVWHYTNSAGLLGIIKSKKMRATQISCLNDATELLYGAEMLIGEIEKHMHEGLPIRFNRLFSDMREMLRSSTPENDSAFVVCFSEKADDLSQWRAYGHGDDAYAIGFDGKAIRDQTAASKNLFLKVCYDLNSRENLLKSVIKKTEEFYAAGLAGRDSETWSVMFLQNWINKLTLIAPAIKHPKFDQEAEWRLVHYLNEEEVDEIDCVQKSGLLSRFINVEIGHKSKTLPITEVMVGPIRHKEISRISVSDLLRAHSLKDVDVTLSGVPFRPL